MLEAFREDRFRDDPLLTSPRRLTRYALIANALCWGIYLLAQWSDSGLFYFLGVDWSRFWGAARAFVLEGPAAAYQLDAIARQMQPLTSFYAGAAAGASPQVGPVPYPPIFLALLAPLTYLPPPVGFATWTILNLALATYVARALARRFEEPWNSLVVPIIVLFAPLMMALFVGQMVILLLACLYQVYQAFERGQEFRAGLWLGLFLLKPQYAAVLMLVLVFKRRWAAVGGAGFSAAVVVAVSLLAGGLGAFEAYVRVLFTSYPGFQGGLAIDPAKMIGWRSLLFDLVPGLGPTLGTLLTALFSILTLAALPRIWSGVWDPTSPRFALQFFGTMLATLLVAYHSQFHGAALLLVPGAIAVARLDGASRLWPIWLTALAGFPVLALVSVAVTGSLLLVYPVCSLLILLGFSVVLEASEARSLAPARRALAFRNNA